jgi:hypothetical protein
MKRWPRRFFAPSERRGRGHVGAEFELNTSIGSWAWWPARCFVVTAIG